MQTNLSAEYARRMGGALTKHTEVGGKWVPTPGEGGGAAEARPQIRSAVKAVDATIAATERFLAADRKGANVGPAEEEFGRSASLAWVQTKKAAEAAKGPAKKALVRIAGKMRDISSGMTDGGPFSQGGVDRWRALAAKLKMLAGGKE